MAENKKDAFTFSDKIKNSKPAFNPFSKRASSKIGNNGKPKKTLFERTRRDAPFFIAALAALLMLPFLYKYSGNVGEGDPIVAPGMADTVFDPERFDFSPSTEDPSGQIAQLAGRDPLSLIKGWGSSDVEDVRYDIDDRDGLADYSGPRSSSSAANRAASTTTRSTSYRKTAPAATRAAFKRSGSTPATKIGELRGASLAARGGGNIGGRFGGQNLKQAANRNSADPVRNPTKPVSLQPLRAAGAPSRSYFGQDNVARARASRDALSKADAAQALKDAVFNPIGQGHVGGLGDGVLAAGGGAGRMEHNGDFKGITPWWWDMMKQREQEKWNYRYHLWRDPWKEAVKAGGTKFFSCLLWGTDDGDMGKVFGTPRQDGSPAMCTIYEKDYSCEDAKASQRLLEAFPKLKAVNCNNNDSYEAWCKSEEHQKADGSSDWSGAKSATEAKGFFKTRFDCWGMRGKKSKKSSGGAGTGGNGGNPNEKNQCESVNKPDFSKGISFQMEDPDEKSFVIVTVKNEIVSEDGTKTNPCPGVKASEECVIGFQTGGELNWSDFAANTKTLLGDGDAEKGEPLFERLLFVRVEGYDEAEVPSNLGALPFSYKALKQDTLLKANTPVTCEFPPFQIKAHTPIIPDDNIGGVLVYNKAPLRYPGAIDVSCKDDGIGLDHNAMKPVSEQKGTAVGVRVYNDYKDLPDADKQNLTASLTEDGATETTFNWTAQDKSKDIVSRDAATYSPVPPVLPPDIPDLTDEIEIPEEDIKIEDDGPLFLDFADKLSKVLPKEDTLDPTKRKGVQTGEAPAAGRWQNCVEDMDAIGRRILVGYLFGDTQAADVLRQAAAVYKGKNEKEKAQLSETEIPSVAGVLDALTILQQNGTTTVSKNTACAVAKTIGANSTDPHGKNSVAKNNNNMFGAFAAFVDEDSSYFPGDKLSNGDIDSRFHGCESGKSVGPGNAYHYGHYNWNYLAEGDLAGLSYKGKHSQDGRKPYEEVLSTGVWKGFPLRDLSKKSQFEYLPSVANRAELKRLGSTNGTIDDVNRKHYYEAYQDVFWGNTSCGYGKDEAMQIEDLFKYIDILCKYGTSIKPANAPQGQSLDCSLHQYQVSQQRYPNTK